MTETWGDLQRTCDRLVRMLVVNAQQHHLFYDPKAPDQNEQVRLALELGYLAEEIGRQRFSPDHPCPEASLVGALAALENEVVGANRTGEPLAALDARLRTDVRLVRKSIE